MAKGAEKYVNQSTAKISYNGTKKENHFELIEGIYHNKDDYGLNRSIFTDIINEQKINNSINMVKEKYHFLSGSRITIIENCLKLRFEKLFKIIRD